MSFSSVKLLVLVLIMNQVTCRYVDIGSPVLDCVRIRSVKWRTLVFGTGYFHTDDNQRYVGIWTHRGTPYNSAFKIERITKYKEPLYYIKMINTQEYLMGGPFSATSRTRIPILTYHRKVNGTRDNDGVFSFEKARDERGAYSEAWYIKNVYYDYYVIGSRTEADPPSGDPSFYLLQMDRTSQPTLTTEHKFWIENC